MLERITRDKPSAPLARLTCDGPQPAVTKPRGRTSGPADSTLHSRESERPGRTARHPFATVAMRPLSLAPISGRRRPASDITRWVVPSLVVHALLVGATAVDLAPRAKDDDRPAHEVIFLAPLLPRAAPAQEADAAEGVTGVPLGWHDFDASVRGVGDVAGAVLGRADGVAHSLVQTQRDLAAAPSADSTASAGDEHIYQAVDVDREVARQADASAPVYPEQLRVTGVSGGVTAQFVVDTVGRVEEGSMHIIGATHPLFAAAVRDAAPGFHFQPAVRSGHVVRQQVIQSFQFVLQPSSTAADSARARADSAKLASRNSRP